MSATLILAITFITLALVWYSIGVWAEKIQGRLKPWHLGFFLLGLVCDTTGTTMMKFIASSAARTTVENPIHTITGVAALALMGVHAVWAAIVLLRKQENMQVSFHKFSLFVWGLWLVPYVLGIILNVG